MGRAEGARLLNIEKLRGSTSAESSLQHSMRNLSCLSQNTVFFSSLPDKVLPRSSPILYFLPGGGTPKQFD